MRQIFEFGRPPKVCEIVASVLHYALLAIAVFTVSQCSSEFRRLLSCARLIHKGDLCFRSCRVLEPWIEEANAFGHLIGRVCTSVGRFHGAEIGSLDCVALDRDLILQESTRVRDVEYTLRHDGGIGKDGTGNVKERE